MSIHAYDVPPRQNHRGGNLISDVHVLFIDTVGYSKLSINDQQAARKSLAIATSGFTFHKQLLVLTMLVSASGS